MKLYNVRDPPGNGDRKICRENIEATRTETVFKSNISIFKDHLSSDFADERFL